MDIIKMNAFPVLIFVLVLSLAGAKKLTDMNEDNCEVCVKFLTKFMDGLTAEVKSKPADIEKAFRAKCKTTKKDDNRFCYYVGGLDESATGMLGELSKPISWGMPPSKVCLKLYNQDSQICDLRYDKTVDFVTVDLKKLKVKDLKRILEDWDTSCKGCTEKQEFVTLIEELMPRYAPEAAEKRKKLRQEL